MVPFKKKKKFDGIKRESVIVTPYKTNEDIENQLHRQDEFAIIVGEAQDFHKPNMQKQYPRLSPRCVLVIEDTAPIKEDEIYLYRFPKKVLYYGPDAYSYLSKYRIPSKLPPFKPQVMKSLFFNDSTFEERIAAYNESFSSF